MPQKYTFRKKNTRTWKFRFWQRCQKVFAQTPSIFSEISKKIQLLVQLRWKFFRFLSEVCTLNCSSGHTVYMFDIPVAKNWHGKNLVTLKLAVLWDFFPLPVVEIAYNLRGFRNGWPDVPQKLIVLPSDSFLITAAAEEDWKLCWNLVFQMISVTFIFFFCHPHFWSTSIVMNNYGKGQTHLFLLLFALKKFPHSISAIK